jgi:hypothetical protein
MQESVYKQRVEPDGAPLASENQAGRDAASVNSITAMTSSPHSMKSSASIRRARWAAFRRTQSMV